MVYFRFLLFYHSFYSTKHSMLFPLTINQSVSVMVNVVVVYFFFIFWRKYKNQQANVHMCWVYLTVLDRTIDE